MTCVVISPSNVVTFPEGGGHFWVYMQYVQGLLRRGCEVYWLERFFSSGDNIRDNQMLTVFAERMAGFGMDGKIILYTVDESASDEKQRIQFIGMEQSAADRIICQADLLLNVHYAMDQVLLSRFRCTALLDIDPGLLQFWMSTGQLSVASHDFYFTIGETVGTERALFPDCDLPWVRINPAICLDLWPYHYVADSEAFTTVSGWWGGGGKGEFITDGQGMVYENNKRVTFLQYVELPRRTMQVLELALNLGEDEEPDMDDGAGKNRQKGLAAVTDYVSDAIDRQRLLDHGWRIQDAYTVAGSPQAYRSYIQQSRGEFSCAKPSCLKFQNAWISDRTICYLASGKPVVIQDTGPSSYLPDAYGMFRFSCMEEAVEAFARINTDYENQCMAARKIAESYFDVQLALTTILDTCVD